MNFNGSKETNKIKRRNFFYYLGAAAAGTFVFSKFPFNLINRKSGIHSSLKVRENPLAVKRSDPRGKGQVNG